MVVVGVTIVLFPFDPPTRELKFVVAVGTQVKVRAYLAMKMSALDVLRRQGRLTKFAAIPVTVYHLC